MFTPGTRSASVGRHRGHGGRARVAAACLLSVAACATASQLPAPNTSVPGVLVRVIGPGAGQYRTEVPPGAGARGPLAAAATGAIEEGERQSGQPRLAADPRLAELAGWVARDLGRTVSAPQYPVIDLYARHLGLTEPTMHLLLLAEPNPERLAQKLVAEIAGLPANQHYTHYGVATLVRRDGAVAVLALSFRRLSLAPVPREIAPGSSFRLQGRLHEGLREAQLVVSYPDGSSSRSAPLAGTSIEFEVATHDRGEYRIELIAQSSDGIQVVANFPVYVGVAPARAVGVAQSGGAALDAGATAARLLSLINRERKAARRKPLTRDARLDAIALAHSQDMHSNGFVAHNSPTTGTAVDRVQRAGLRTPLVLENIGRGYGAEAIHQGLMESPGHRENILNPDATHIGIGVVLTAEETQTAYLVTELFARFASPIAVDSAASQLLAQIAQRRKGSGLRPLAHAEALSALCERAAQSFFRDPASSKEQVLSRLTEAATALHPPYAQLTAAAALVSSVDEAALLQTWLDPSARAVAVGFAQGTRDDTMNDAILMLALLAY